MEISEKYNGKFVGKFYWKYYEDNLEKHYTFSKNGKISSEFPN
jgi:hypothetical protein